jgi:hypothetical protein
MGEIIHIDFEKKKKIDTNTSTNISTNTEADPLTKNINKESFLTVREFASYYSEQVRKHGFNGFGKINNLAGSQSSFLQNKKLVDGYSDKELINWLAISTESDWVKKPSFYKAILSEINARKDGKNHKII